MRRADDFCPQWSHMVNSFFIIYAYMQWGWSRYGKLICSDNDLADARVNKNRIFECKTNWIAEHCGGRTVVAIESILNWPFRTNMPQMLKMQMTGLFFNHNNIIMCLFIFIPSFLHYFLLSFTFYFVFNSNWIAFFFFKLSEVGPQQ